MCVRLRVEFTILKQMTTKLKTIKDIYYGAIRLKRTREIYVSLRLSLCLIKTILKTVILLQGLPLLRLELI